MAINDFILLPKETKAGIVGQFLNDLEALSNKDTILLSRRGKVTFTEELNPFKLSSLISLIIQRSKLPENTVLSIFEELVSYYA